MLQVSYIKGITFVVNLLQSGNQNRFTDFLNLSKKKVKDAVKSNRTIKTVSLTSASGSANRAIGSMPLYQQLKTKNPNFTTFDFRVMQYSEFF